MEAIKVRNFAKTGIVRTAVFVAAFAAMAVLAEGCSKEYYKASYASPAGRSVSKTGSWGRPSCANGHCR